MAFESLRKVVDNTKRLDINKLVITELSTPESKKLIIRLNTQEQLFESGEDSRGIKLETIDSTGRQGYTSRTIQIKRVKGQPTDRVTLKDTGDFYDSFRVISRPNEIEIVANTFKDGENLEDRWGNFIIGLQEGSLNEVIKNIIEPYRDALLEGITKGV